MKTIFEHIEHIQGKPHHVRKQIAFGTAAAAATLVGLVWLAGSLSLGTFAIKGSSFAESTGQTSVIATDHSTDTANIAGAAAVLPSDSAPARIEIVNATSSAPEQSNAGQTTIPF